MWAYLVSCLNHLSACLTQFYGSNTLGKIQTAHRFSQVLLHWSNLHNHQGFAVTTYTKQNSRLLSKGLKFYLIHVLIYLTRIFFFNFSYQASPAVGRWVWSSYREHGSVYSVEHGLRPLDRTVTCWCSEPLWVEFHLHQTYWLAQTLPSPLG